MPRVVRAGAHEHDRHLAPSHRRWVSRRDERRRFPVPLRGDRERRLQSCRVCRRCETRCPRRSNTSRRSITGTLPSCPKAACSSSDLRRPGCSWPREMHRSGRPVTLCGRRARPPAAHLSRTRCALVDGVVRRVGSAIRPDRRHHARAEAPVAAARWHS